ncbi:RNA polymerase factor sigma-54 [Galenea microaerophila]
MAIMPGLHINIGQNLKLTPQLQQSIKILQYSALEVQQTIETTLQTNYMLEVVDELEEDFTTELEQTLDEEKPETSSDDVSTEETNNSTETPVDLETSDQIQQELEIDCDWQEVYSDYEMPRAQTVSNEEYTAAENYTASHETLHDKLYWQSDIYPWQDEHQQAIAEFIIDRIDEDGFLTVSLESLTDEIQQQLPEIELELESVEAVLKVIQQFEPTGVGARSLQETLLIQLASQGQTPYVVTAQQLIQENFDWLTDHDYKRIKKAYHLTDEELTTLLKLIQSLNPRPGGEFCNTEQSVIVPDLILSRQHNTWKVELNPNVFPKLRINPIYLDLTRALKDDKQSMQIKEQLLEAKGLIKSIQNRGETLMRVGQYIVQSQARFFEEGEQAMQPMVLRDVAEALELHESTISRATNQKYIQTPRGTYELKFFFSTGVSQYGAEDQSSIAIKSHIKELIENENPAKPLSDSKLTKMLAAREIIIARRTVAKYREAMGIPSSSERKKAYALKHLSLK